jgi:hypothetical protein
MADEHDKPEDPQDPWADLDAGDLPDLGEGLPISFDDDAPATPADEPAVDEATEIPAASSAGDSDIDAWLNDPADEPRPSLSVFQEDDGVAMTAEDDQGSFDRSSIEIGTGTSGMPSPSSLEMTSDVVAESDGVAESSLDDNGFFSDEGDDFPAAMLDGDAAVSPPPAELAEAAIAFDEADGMTEPVEVVAAMTADAADVGPRTKKKGGLGTLAGILAGGLLAIPITLGILLWGFGRDPFGIASMLPESLAFLAPGPAAGSAPLTAPAADEPGSRSVEPSTSEPAATELAAEPGITEPVASEQPPEPPTDPPVTDETGPEPMGDVASTDEPAVDGDEPAVANDEMADDRADEVPEPEVAVMAPADPVLDAPAITPDSDQLLAILEPPVPLPTADVAPVVPEEPAVEPLDLTAVDEAAAAAVAVTAEIAALDDLAAPGHRRELAAWYRSLAAYADSLAALDRTAAETGRGLDEAAASLELVPRQLVEHPELHATIARLTRDWIGYDRRTSDGVVVPGRFQGCRPIGPWWRSEVSIGDTEGRPEHLLVVMTRSEPTAASDDLVLITGLAVDGDVIWAADLRTAGSAAVESDL